MATSNGTTTIQRTSRGLTVAGTRLTLYTILDHLNAGWTPTLVRQWFQLTEEQMDDIVRYIEEHRAEVEKEYAEVIARAEENRRYWKSRNRTRESRHDPSTLSSEHRAIWEKLQAWKKQARGRMPDELA